MRKHNTFRITVIGGFGFDNLGDDLILRSALGQMRGTISDVKITVLSNNPRETASRHGGQDVIFSAEALLRQIILRFMARISAGYQSYLLPIPGDSFRRLFNSLRNCDLVVSLGGGYLNDYSKFVTHFRLAELVLIGLLRKRLFLCAHEVGPLRRMTLRRFATLSMKFVTYATVRDEESLRVLSDLGVSGERILFTADESWAYDPKNALRFGSIMNKKAGGLVVALNLIPLQVVANVPRSSKEQFETEQVNVQIISGIVSCLESLGVVSRIFFLSMSAQDSRIVSRLRVALKGRVPLEVFKDLDSQYLALGQSDVLIGMRMHTIIMAAQMNVPPIALALLPKVRGVMNELGLSEYIVEALPFHEAQFQNAFSRALQDRPRIREKLETRAKDFMQRASLNTKIISRLLNETSPGVRKRW